MSQFLSDTFTDTNGTLLSAHAGEVGATWVKHPSANTGDAEISSNALRDNSTSNTVVYYASGVPIGADYEVEAMVTIFDAGNANTGIMGRLTTSGNLNGYLWRFVSSGSLWQLGKFTGAGSFASLATAAAPGTGSYTLKLSMVGSAIKGYVDGVEKCSVTDTDVTAAGRAGVRVVDSATAAIIILSMTATDVAASTTTIAVNDSNFLAGLTPWNWYRNGSTAVVSQYTPAGVNISFAGTRVALNVDVSPITASGLTASQWPKVYYSIDGGAFTESQLTSSTAQICLTTGLADATHTLDMWISATASTGENWATPQNAVKITGIEVGAGKALASRTLPTTRALIYGDSIARGKGLLNSATPTGEGVAAWSKQFCDAMNWRPGIVGISGQGWVNTGAGGEGAFSASWSYYSSGKSRTGEAPPDYIFICHGTNDTGSSDATVTAAVTSTVNAIRAQWTAAPIFIVVPIGQFKASAIAAGYAAITNKTSIFLLDCGPEISTGLTTIPAGAATASAPDGLHPNYYAIGRVVGKLAQKFQEAVSGPRNSVSSITIQGQGMIVSFA